MRRRAGRQAGRARWQAVLPQVGISSRRSAGVRWAGPERPRLPACGSSAQPSPRACTRQESWAPGEPPSGVHQLVQDVGERDHAAGHQPLAAHVHPAGGRAWVVQGSAAAERRERRQRAESGSAQGAAAVLAATRSGPGARAPGACPAAFPSAHPPHNITHLCRRLATILSSTSCSEAAGLRAGQGTRAGRGRRVRRRTLQVAPQRPQAETAACSCWPATRPLQPLCQPPHPPRLLRPQPPPLPQGPPVPRACR